MDNFNGMIGKSAKMQEIYQLIDIAAKSSVTVLLQGETGTGKELTAQAIHNRSDRVKYPFIPINCAAIPQELAESELFGHEKGAFTSAVKERIGKLELAHGGTMLLDEIGEMSLSLQAKILRVVEDKMICRIGSAKPIKVNIRIIASTNQPLAKRVKEKAFRDDLYYRLSIFVINLPPLREHKEDIPDLVNYFINIAKKEFNTNGNSISKKALNKLMEYDWPGNIRELRNVIYKTLIIKEDNTQIMPEDIHLPIDQDKQLTRWDYVEADDKESTTDRHSSLMDMEVEAIKRILREKDGNKKAAAKALGIGRSSLYWKIKKYGL